MRLTAGQQFRSAHAPRFPQQARSAETPRTGPHAVSAVVRDRNTAASDMESHVWHIVTMSDDTTRSVLATDPLDAIHQINR